MRLGAVAATRCLKMANIAQVVNVLQSMILTNDTQMVLTPTYYAFKMYNVHQNAEYLSSDISQKGIPADFKSSIVPSVDVTASKKDGLMHISLVNTVLDKAQKVSVSFDGQNAVSKVLSAEVLTSKDVRDHNDFSSPDAVKPEDFKDFNLSNGTLTVTLPPFSILSIALR